MKLQEVWKDVNERGIFNMKGQLRFITCGSVDDGKSTLIGHMLYDAKLLYIDQEKALELDSKIGNTEQKLDYSLILDGLIAEREQKITIDVAYRFFTTKRRSFIVADTPGHEEYTRNMAVGASFAELAVILVDATKGVLEQTKRHVHIVAMMGIKYVVFAINKIDLVDYNNNIFFEIEKAIDTLCHEYTFNSKYIIPVSASEGDNLTIKSIKTPWFKGNPLLTYLEEIETENISRKSDFIMPIQRVCRPNQFFRGFQGQIEQGEIEVGDEVSILPSNETAHIKEILITDKKAEKAFVGQPVTITLDKEIDASRGCVFVTNKSLQTSNMFTSTILWMSEEVLVAGRNYFLKIGTKFITATIMNIKYKVDINSKEHVVADQIKKNEIAVCDIVTAEKIVVEEFEKCKALGGILLIDRVTYKTAACGVIEHTLRRSDNLTQQYLEITKESRALRMGQKPYTLWFTGLSGSGKSTLANEVEKNLYALGKYTMLLDGDNIRMGLNKNLGFKEKDRIENSRRVAEVAKLMNEAGLIVITAFISPFLQDREEAKKIIGDNFIEIYVSTPLEECEKRDVKGLYKKAREGSIPNFTGISSPYEPPINPDITIDTSKCTLSQAAEIVIDYLEIKSKEKLQNRED